MSQLYAKKQYTGENGGSNVSTNSQELEAASKVPEQIQI